MQIWQKCHVTHLQGQQSGTPPAQPTWRSNLRVIKTKHAPMTGAMDFSAYGVHTTRSRRVPWTKPRSKTILFLRQQRYPHNGLRYSKRNQKKDHNTPTFVLSTAGSFTRALGHGVSVFLRVPFRREHRRLGVRVGHLFDDAPKGPNAA